MLWKYTYKAGVLLGLGLYALGAFLFYPAMLMGNYYPFLLAYFTLTCGLSFLETSCNPYILSLGTEETSTRRLNLAQAFNPLGSLLGMYVAMNFIQARMSPLDTAERSVLPDAEFEALKQSDLSVLVTPYLAIWAVTLLMLILIAVVRLPNDARDKGNGGLFAAIKRIFSIKHYREGVITQFFYVGAQIMCWTFIIQYGTHLFMSMGMDVAACCCTAGTIFLQNIWGMYCLVGISACMSLMFPTIYGIALKGLGEDAKFGAAGLIMAILGGSVLPPVQASIIDLGNECGMPAVNLSFLLPFICFVVIIIYGHRVHAGKI